MEKQDGLKLKIFRIIIKKKAEKENRDVYFF